MSNEPDLEKKRKLERERKKRYRAKKNRDLNIERATQIVISPELLSNINPDSQEEEIRLPFPEFSRGQKEFLELLKSRRFVSIRAGRQYGKSTVGIAGVVQRIYRHPVKTGVGWVVSPTYPMAEQLRYKFEELLEPLIVDKREGNTPVYFLEPPPGWSRPYRVEFKTAEKPDRLRGPTLDWMWLDEARNMDRSIWPIILPTVAVSRGPIFVTTTPAGKDWVYEIFDVNTEKGEPEFGRVIAKSSEAPQFNMADIALMRGQMSEDMAKQELDAEIVSFDGLVYPGFRSELHVIDPIDQIPDHAQVLGGIDFGWKDPFVHLWGYKLGSKYVIYDEYYANQKPISSHASAIKGGLFNSRVLRRWADPSNPQMSAELERFGIGAYPAQNDIKLGIDCVKKIIEQRRLLVTRNCVQTLRELSQYHYPDKKGANTKDIPAPAFDHAMDALRYMVYSEESNGTNNPYATISDDGKMIIHDLPKTRFGQWESVQEINDLEETEEWF